MSQIEYLNHEEAKFYVGGLIFVSVTTVLGIIGNIHVLFIYAFRMKASNPRTFILCLAVLDLITSSIGMPFIIFDLTHPLTFTIVPACKVLRFLNYFICISSAFVLVVIAIDRYRKVCCPLGRQISHGSAKYACLLAMIAAFTVSWPAPVLYGHSSIHTSNPNITGVRCFTDDKFKQTPYQAYFNFTLIAIFCTAFLILVILYILIARAIQRHAEFVKSFRSPKLRSLQNRQMGPKTTDCKDGIVLKCMFLEYDSGNSVLLGESPSRSSNISTEHSKSSDKNPFKLVSSRTPGSQRFQRMKRTSFTMFLLTLCFFCSYIPHFSLKIAVFVKRDLLTNTNFTGKVLYNTFVWCFFFNNISNSFIYGFSDRYFKLEVVKLYRNIYASIRRNIDDVIHQIK